MRRAYWLALSLLFILPTIAYGDSEAPLCSYVRDSPNGKYLFVMLAPRNARYDDGAELKNIFPASGMYLNDVSKTPLWTVDWYAHSVMVFSDGVHVVRSGPWARELSDEALTFFANGKMLRSYRVGDLVDLKIFLERTVSHFWWERADDSEFNETNHTFSLATISDEKYTFDYTTGEIISARRPMRAFVVLLAVIVLFLALRRFGRGRSAAQT
jgi:hypothetical protein